MKIVTMWVLYWFEAIHTVVTLTYLLYFTWHFLKNFFLKTSAWSDFGTFKIMSRFSMTIEFNLIWSLMEMNKKKLTSFLHLQLSFGLL